MAVTHDIEVKGARVNNLKNIDVNIPRGKLVVITGLSGSGKSSLAFDTLYAEGQRRYVESLSAYTRQFLGRMPKPECDYIKGLPPAIAIEQRTNTRNSRSTVGTSTEIYDYLRLLFARIGVTYSPVTGEEVKKHSPEDVIAWALSFPEGTRLALLAPLRLPQGRSFKQQIEVYMKEGYSRLERDGDIVDMASITDDATAEGYYLLIDRLSVNGEKETYDRLFDSVETALYEGQGQCTLKMWTADGIVAHDFSTRFEADGITFAEPSDLMFNFNNPIGACPVCEGFGRVVGIDEDLVIPDKSLSVYDDAVLCWRGTTMSEWKKELIRIAGKIGFPIHRPYYQLTEEQRDALWHGTAGFPGIDGFFKWVESKSYSIQYRVLLSRYRGKTVCPECHGTRLRKEASYVKINGATISDLVAMPVSELRQWFDNLELTEHQQLIAKRLLTELRNRIGFLCDIGLEYLTLDRLSATLSGGESQRINLATSLGSSLVGSLYILDEPSVGLHSRDTRRLIGVLRKLQRIGNTVVVVEHDEEIIRAADYIIDIGPEAGARGGQVVYQGEVASLDTATDSYTLDYLTGKRQIAVPQHRRPWRNYIEVVGAAQNNLKGINVKFPLGVITVVTGVSGSGKSSLVCDILYRALGRYYGSAVYSEQPGIHTRLDGDLNMLHTVNLVDQTPIAQSSRSNPAIYIGAFDSIRYLYAAQPLAQQLGVTAAAFSFNSAEGGRCEECNGEGTITIEMQFMADITIPCEACHGRRYKKEILEIEYKGKNIADVLDMTVDEAIEFFKPDDKERSSSHNRSIVEALGKLHDVGLGYIHLGQSSSSLSGGERQRLKLAAYMGTQRKRNLAVYLGDDTKKSDRPCLFIFDEPTTGLHFHDINVLMECFNRLIQQGHTVVIIEHNIDVIKSADHVIDLGPEGGKRGGNIVAEGTPEEVAKCPESYTGHFLRAKLGL